MQYYQPLGNNLVLFVSSSGFVLTLLRFQKFLQSTNINTKFQSDEEIAENVEIVENVGHPHDVIVPTGPEIDYRVEIHIPVRVFTSAYPHI